MFATWTRKSGDNQVKINEEAAFPGKRIAAVDPDPWEDPKSRSPYGVDYRTLRWIYFLDPPRGL